MRLPFFAFPKIAHAVPSGAISTGASKESKGDTPLDASAADSIDRSDYATRASMKLVPLESPDPLLTTKRRQKWVVTEKIHGANFSFVTGVFPSSSSGGDGQGSGASASSPPTPLPSQQYLTQCAKRTGLIAPQDDFFGYKRGLFLSTHERKAEGALKYLRAKDPTVLAVQIYGELFGGLYPHPDVSAEREQTGGPVQFEILYHPSLCFSVFDILVWRDRAGGAASLAPSFLDYDLVLETCHAVELHVCEPLFVGSREEALHYEPVEFVTRIPEAFRLPPLPHQQQQQQRQASGKQGKQASGRAAHAKGDTSKPASEPATCKAALVNPRNLAEGVVIKPIVPLFAVSGKRVVVKRKIALFQENKLDEGASERTAVPHAKEGGDTSALLKFEADALVTEMRVTNAVSKMGRREAQEQRGQLVEMVVVDVLEDLKLSYDDELERLGSASLVELTEHIRSAVQELALGV